MMLTVLSRQSDTDMLRDELMAQENRISALESKIGTSDEISERLGLAIRNLPMPPDGMSELQNVWLSLNEIHAPGLNTEHVLTEAVRVGNVGPKRGSVKVEIIDEMSRSCIMKNKKNSTQHPNILLKNLVIRNLKTVCQINFDNFARDLMKFIPGGENLFIAPNGNICQRNPIYSSQSRE